MKFIIEYIKPIDGKDYHSYFAERIGIMSVMVPRQSEAMIYDTKLAADADRKRYFGKRKQYRTINLHQTTWTNGRRPDKRRRRNSNFLTNKINL